MKPTSQPRTSRTPEEPVAKLAEIIVEAEASQQAGGTL
jgi:hypothetical protein